MRLHAILSGLALIFLGACGEDKSITNLTCEGLEADPGIFIAFEAAAPEMTTALEAQASAARVPAAASQDDNTRAAITSAMARMIASKSGAIEPGESVFELGTARTERPVINILALSTGGQYGAFGSGFLAGWGKNNDQPRPTFDLVTGASAGGIFAPFAFAGAEFDSELARNAGVSESDVYRERSIVELLFSASIFDTKPQEDSVREAVDAKLISAMARGYEDGRALLLGATNLNTGKFVAFDLGAYAASEAPNPICISEAILATSAIPALFKPRKINNDLFVDAGVRSHLFIEGLRDAEDLSAVDPIVNVYVVVNGDLVVPADDVKASLIDVSQKSFSLVTDEGLRQSVLRSLKVAEERDWNVRGILAPDVREFDCTEENGGKPEALFSPCITNELFRRGMEAGASTEIPWLSAAQLQREILKGRVGEVQ